ncbi:retrovirus-related pol polyprotein from transposon TNT 1-94 [Tanacetum coccineum]
MVDEVVDEGVSEKEPAHDDEEANLQRALELSLKEQGERTQGPTRPVVIWEPDSIRIQPRPEVQEKGKEKVTEEQVAHNLLTLQTPKPKNPADQFIFQRRPPMPTEPSKHAESPSLDVELALTNSETKSEEQAPVIKAGHQDEGQARPNPGEKDEGQASNPGDAVESQPQPSHVVHVGPNLEHMDLETTDASTQQKPEQMDEEFTTTTYPNKSQEEEPRKTNAEAEVQSIVLVPIHQDTSSVPPMTTLVIDLTKDLPTVEMKEILQQRMFEDNTYKTHEVHNYLYKALQKLVELDYSNQCLADQEEVRKKKRKRRESPRTPPGSPPIQPPSPPPPSGASADIPGAQELSPTNYLMQDDSIPEEQVHLSDDEDSENDHQPKADSRKDWWKPLPEEEGPATLEPAWAIPSSNKSFLESAFGW